MKHQRGLALSQLIVWGIVVALVAITGMKVVPSVIQYSKLKAAIEKTAKQVGPEATVPEVKKTFERYTNVDGIDDFKPDRLDITKNAGKIVVAFDYDDKIPLFYNVSLLINYKASTAGK
jgi:Domain of unknown function (DUF4845)